jgi:hypothetical protein
MVTSQKKLIQRLQEFQGIFNKKTKTKAPYLQENISFSLTISPSIL